MSEIKQPQDYQKPDTQPTAGTSGQPVIEYESVTINGIKYQTPQMGLLDRASAKRIQSLVGRVTGEDSLDDLWELVDTLLVDTPVEDIDRLRIDDVKAILSAAGVISFTNEHAPNPSNLTITLGESLASTDS